MYMDIMPTLAVKLDMQQELSNMMLLSMCGVELSAMLDIKCYTSLRDKFLLMEKNLTSYP